jgi:hypothetical protein
MSQKPFMWNNNNPVQWSDPTFFPVIVPMVFVILPVVSSNVCTDEAEATTPSFPFELMSKPKIWPPSEVVSTGPSEPPWRTAVKCVAGVTPPAEVVVPAHAQSASSTRQELGNVNERFIQAFCRAFMKKS